MTAFEQESTGNRAELLQRIELMESMIAEGRTATVGSGWIFMLWGVVCLLPFAWQILAPNSHFASKWAWPVCLGFGWVLTVAGLVIQKRSGTPRSAGSRNVGAVWGVMGVAMGIYVMSGILFHFSWQVSYLAAIMLLLGMAHGTSAAILRWPAQGVLALIYWAGVVATFCNPPGEWIAVIFAAETVIGGILFGLYAMMLERRERSSRVQHG
jgi:hypothetical protein